MIKLFLSSNYRNEKNLDFENILSDSGASFLNCNLYKADLQKNIYIIVLKENVN